MFYSSSWYLIIPAVTAYIAADISEADENGPNDLINFAASKVFIYLVNAVSASSVKPPTNNMF